MQFDNVDFVLDLKQLHMLSMRPELILQSLVKAAISIDKVSS